MGEICPEESFSYYNQNIDFQFKKMSIKNAINIKI